MLKGKPCLVQLLHLGYNKPQQFKKEKQSALCVGMSVGQIYKLNIIPFISIIE